MRCRSVGMLSCLALTLLGASLPAAGAVVVDPDNLSVRLDLFAGGLDIFDPPTDLAPLGDGSGRLLVSTLTGTIRLLDASGTFLDSDEAPYIDSRATTSITEAYGATSVTVHPGFADPESPGYRKIYGIVTEEPGGPLDFEATGSGNHTDVLAEWTISDLGNSPSVVRRDVARFGQPAKFHNVGDVTFGLDGLLYVPAGDGGVLGANAQDPTSFLGSVLRFDPLGSEPGDFTVPEDNPFFGNDQGFVEAIYTYGHRAPFRINPDRETGDLFIGEVGSGGTRAREEINRIRVGEDAGVNYGWNEVEGSAGDPRFRDPVFEYPQSEGQSVCGGFVYRGSAIPGLVGKYVFADFGRQVTTVQEATPARLFYGDLSTGEIYEFNLDPTGEQLADEEGGTISNIFSIGEDADGELYLLVGDDPFNEDPDAAIPEGRILRVVPEADGMLAAVGCLLLLGYRRGARRQPGLH